MKPSSSTSDGGGLTGYLFGYPPVDTAVGDRAFVQAMLAAEAALARAAATVGAFPTESAEAIAAACDALDVDVDALGRDSVSSGNPVVPLVQLLRAAVPDDIARWVHYGATSQDIIDTALMLMSKAAGAIVLERLTAAADSCARLADEHRYTMMIARTLGQQAAPTTFGRKAAGWLSGLDAATARLSAVCDERLAAQLGGPVGTLASFGTDGADVVASYATALGLQPTPLPWHTDRSRVLDLTAALGTAVAAAGKIAVDVTLLAQSEIAEVSTAAPGGSSSMPHKRNPTAAILITAGAARAPGLIATMYAAASPEHERAIGAWHSEWETWRELLRVAGGVADRCAILLDGLQVAPARMRTNFDAASGALLSDSIAEQLGAAQQMVDRALADHRETGRRRS
jgi:3-carboxy-cis,cis-muconate cycloisomerase